MSEYEYVIIIILSSGSVWPVVHNLMVRTLEANKKVDECTKTQSFVLCEQHILQTLITVILNPEKPESFKDCQKLSVVVFFTAKEWKTVYTTWPVMLHSATIMYSWRLHTVASKTTSSQTKTRHAHTQTSAILLWVSAQVFNCLSTEKKYTKGSRMPSHFLKRIPDRHFSQTFSHRTSI